MITGIDGEFQQWVGAMELDATQLRRNTSLDIAERRRLVKLANGLQVRPRQPE